jgi:hypothetical protein
MRAKRYKWYWVEYLSKNKKRAYKGPAYSTNGMHNYYSDPTFRGIFKLPSGELAQFYDGDIIRELNKNWVKENYPSYDYLLNFWKTNKDK